MFDTVRMKTNVTIDPDVLPCERTKQTHKLDKETGEIRSTYQVRHDLIHYIFYSETTRLLIIEASIPKFLFGNNVRTVNESDVVEFWTKLQKELFELCTVEIDQASWIVERLDVCLNFNVGNQIGEYIAQMANKHVPYCKPHLIGHYETVEFKTSKNKRVMTCYDKQLQCIANAEPPDVIEQAKGILRFEVSPSKHELVTYSSRRRARDFLTKHFYLYIMSKSKVQKVLQFPETLEPPIRDLDWLKSQESIMQIETMLGFKSLLDAHGESGLKKLYNSQTFASRKKLVQQTKTPPVRRLADLL